MIDITLLMGYCRYRNLPYCRSDRQKNLKLATTPTVAAKAKSSNRYWTAAVSLPPNPSTISYSIHTTVSPHRILQYPCSSRSSSTASAHSRRQTKASVAKRTATPAKFVPKRSVGYCSHGSTVGYYCRRGYCSRTHKRLSECGLL